MIFNKNKQTGEYEAHLSGNFDLDTLTMVLTDETGIENLKQCLEENLESICGDTYYIINENNILSIGQKEDEEEYTEELTIPKEQLINLINTWLKVISLEPDQILLDSEEDHYYLTSTFEV